MNEETELKIRGNLNAKGGKNVRSTIISRIASSSKKKIENMNKKYFSSAISDGL